jgi:methyl-accepting chemotaxis protein
MSWKNATLGKKIMIGIGIVLVLLSLVAVWALTGITGIVHEGMEVAGGNRLRGELLQREVDHLNWAQAVSRPFTTTGNGIDCSAGPTQCGLGKWFYGDERKKAEMMLPELKGPQRP